MDLSNYYNCKRLEIIEGELLMENGKIKIVIADDNKEFSSILSEYLRGQNDFEVVGIAKDGLRSS